MGFPTVPRPGRRGGWKRLVGGPKESQINMYGCDGSLHAPLRCAMGDFLTGQEEILSFLRLQTEVQPSSCSELQGKKCVP